MCFVIFCCCDSCNSYSSKCVEFFIFIISFLSFILTILAFFFIKREHLRLLCFIILIVLIFFSLIILFSSCLILIFRHKQTINTTQNKSAIIFSIIGLIITIFYFILMISEISLIHTDYYSINHPCSSKEKKVDNIKSIENLVEEGLKEFCINNQNYNTNLIALKEFIITYIFGASLLLTMLSLIYSWFNEYRRVKYLINGSLHNFSIKEKIEEKNSDDEDDDDNNNKEVKIKNQDVNNNIEVNSKFKKLDEKNNSNVNNNGISIYISKNNIDNKSLAASSDIILTGNNKEKISISKKK